MSKTREPHWIEVCIFFGSILAGLAGMHGLCVWGAIVLIGSEISEAIENK